MRAKRNLSILILFALLLSAIVPFSAFADGDVAKIGETTYSDIKVAFEALKSGDTLELLADVSSGDLVTLGKSVTINGNGHTYSYTGTDYAFLAGNDAGAITFQNFILSSKNGGIKVQKNVSLVMESDVRMTTADKTFLFYAGAASQNSTVHIKGGVYTSNKGILQATGNTTGRKIRVDGGSFTNKVSSILMQVVDMQVDIYGGSFINEANSITMVAQGASLVTVYGGAIISANPDSKNPTLRLDQTTVATVYDGYLAHKGAGNTLFVNDQATADKTITLFGGTFAANSAAVVNAADDKRQVVINGGQFYGAAENLLTGNLKLNGGFVTVSGEKVQTVSAPTMLKGASARLVDGSNGIRFESVISKAAIDYANGLKDEGTEISYGTVIAPTDQLAGLSGMSMNALSAMGKVYENVVAKDGISTDEGGNVRIRASLVNLKTENIGRALSAVSYISYIKNGVTVYLYAAYAESLNSRSMSYVADAALKDVKDAAEGLYQYEFNGKFSPYTEAQRAVLQGYLNTVGN